MTKNIDWQAASMRTDVKNDGNFYPFGDITYITQVSIFLHTLSAPFGGVHDTSRNREVAKGTRKMEYIFHKIEYTQKCISIVKIVAHEVQRSMARWGDACPLPINLFCRLVEACGVARKNARRERVRPLKMIKLINKIINCLAENY